MKTGTIFSRIFGRKMRDAGSDLFSFHKTVIGYRHVQEGLPCQDSSVSYEDKNGAFQIIAVADGHGSPACCRSEKGAAYITEIAKQCLERFAAELPEAGVLFSQLQKRECIRQLVNAIVSKWYEAVRCDLEKHPVAEEELVQAGDYEEQYRRGRQLEHLYGTTLIAALKTRDVLLLLQQGDGRCDVFYEDGSIEQPIPWDCRCKGHMTTSMCDADVAESIRSCILDLREKKVIACYMGSDGVEDSYYDNEESQLGTHRFYQELSCSLGEYGSSGFEEYLDRQLPEFSRNGSTDDISIAGIVDLEAIKKHIPQYRERLEQYDYRENLKLSLELVSQKLVSMARKHSILGKQRNDAPPQDAVHEEFARYDAEYRALLEKREVLQKLLNGEKE